METSGTNYPLTRRHIPQECIPHPHRCEDPRNPLNRGA